MLSPPNALTVDVEDYYHVSAFEPYIRRADWEHHESRVVANTHRVLELFEKHEVRATFFVLGWVAERFPQLVRDISRHGHELGCHSYAHRLIYQMTPDEFHADLVRARDAIQEAAGMPVLSYRAPSFSITRQSLWALDILAEEGIRFDSSVFPVYHDRYGIPDAKPEVHRIDTPSGPLWEFPPSVIRLGPVNLPVSGGGYFRLYPLVCTAWSLRRIHRRHGRPFVFYVHPWELDPQQPRLKLASRLSRFRHYVNLASTERKLDMLLSQFAFAPMGEVIKAIGQPQPVSLACPQPLA
jgi:polysaccharide deacetylase family protein (PEP-CTERM system associated)